MSSRPGTRERYEILRPLGEGGMGKVYLAQDRERGEKVALKFLLAPLNPAVHEFFREEVKLLSRLSHPNLIRIFDFYDATAPRERLPSGPYFSMEYIEGVPLHQAGKDLTPQQWTDLAAQLCQGLHYLHSRNVLHRDLKPSNILLAQGNQAKILDFGLSTTARGPKSGKTMGTIVYMPPEAFWGDYTAPSDLFSLGVLLYECLSGRFPYKKPFHPPVPQMEAPVPLRRLRPDLPPFLCDLIHHALETSALRRPPSALSMLQFLNHHVDTPFAIVEEKSAEAVLQKVPLIGREAAIQDFQKALRTVKPGSPPVLIRLEGPTGVGRSRFLEELKWKFQLEGTPYATVSPQEAGEWAYGALQRLGLDGGAKTGLHSIDQARDLLRKTADKLHVLVFCDLQDWPEEALAELRVFLGLALGSISRLLLILEFNSDLPKPALTSLETLFQNWPNVARIVLEDLSAEHSSDLITSATPDNPIPQELAQKVVSASGGRPLLLLESLRHILVHGIAARPEESLAETFPVFSRNLQEVTKVRVGNLSETARALLALLAVHSTPAGLSEAKEVWGVSDADFDDALLELDCQGFIETRDSNHPLLRFAQPSLRPLFLQALSETLLASSHRAWVRHLQGRLGEQPPPDFETLLLAEHAYSIEDAETLRRCGLNAAEFLVQKGKEAQAVEWYRRLLKFATTGEERYLLEGSQAPLLYRLGRFDEASEAYDRWFEDRPDDATYLQKTKHRFYTGFVFFNAGREDEARARLKDCLSIADSRQHPAHRPYHCRALACLAAMEEKKGDLEAARRHLQEALSLQIEEPILLGEIEQRLGEVEKQDLHFSEALAHFNRALTCYRQAGQPQAEAVALQCIAMLHLDSGRISEALETAVRSTRLSRESGQVLQGARYEVGLAFAWLARADYGKALSCLEESRQIMEVLGNEEDHFILEICRAGLYLHLGNLDRSDRIFQKLISKEALLKKKGHWEALRLRKGEGFYLYGRYSQAESCFTAALESLAPDSKPVARLDCLLPLARCLARQGILHREGKILKRILEALAPLSGPYFECWRRALEWLGTGPERRPDPSLFLALTEALKTLEMPEVRLDISLSLAANFKRRGMEKSFRQLQETCRNELQQIHRSLPEELKMDFEKNRGTDALDQTFSEMLESPVANPAPNIPVPGGSATEGVPKISEFRFRQFCEINRQISQKNDVGEILERVMDAAIELTGAERGFLLLKDGAAQGGPLPGFEVKTARGLNHQSLGQEEFKLSLSAVKQAVDQGSSLLTSDAQSDDRLQSKKSVVLYQLKAILVVPLEFEGQIQGAIYLDHRYRPACFNEESVALLTAFAVQAALAIQKTKMIAGLKSSNQKLSQEVESLSGELNQVREQLRYGYEEIVGKSPAMMRVFQLLDHVTETAIPVWVHGESGTGKELIARALHFNSPRQAAPFVTENCSAIPETLLESELFGHKKGAFTHADRDRIGLFEQANQGTLFLDEVADMSLAMQAKLLRVLQDGEIRPVGSSKKVKIDVRLVTASNRDLEKLVEEGKFRQDLFYRINGITIPLPALRERKEDIPLLVNHLIEKISRDFKLKPSEVSDEAFQVLMEHPWPGNIRQLEAVIRNALLFSKGRVVTPEVLTITKTLKEAPRVPETAAGTASAVPNTEKEEEKQMIMEALKRHRMNKRLAAEEMGVSLRSLYFRMERHGIPKNKPVLAKFLGLKS